MSSSYWYLPLERCRSLDEIGAHWHALLEAHCSAPTWPEPRYRDAVLQFAGMSALPPRLKLGALLAWGSAFDVDLRLALGALLDAAVEHGLAWPDAVAAAVSDNGPALEVETADPWLGAFVAGRLAGLRETFVHDGLRPEAWQAAFWNAFLGMACRHGDAAALRLALDQGADPLAADGAAIAAAAAGADAHELAGDAPAQADYEAVLAGLLEHAAATRPQLLAIAFPAAAAANNVATLAFLAAHGVEVAAAGTAALAAAAGHMAIEAFTWLREHGADARHASVLAAAAATLDETMIELALHAGAGVEGSADAAFLAALDSQPWDLYSVESEFDEWRPAILALLWRHGLRADSVPLAARVQDLLSDPTS